MYCACEFRLEDVLAIGSYWVEMVLPKKFPGRLQDEGAFLIWRKAGCEGKPPEQHTLRVSSGLGIGKKTPGQLACVSNVLAGEDFSAKPNAQKKRPDNSPALQTTLAGEGFSAKPTAQEKRPDNSRAQSTLAGEGFRTKPNAQEKRPDRSLALQIAFAGEDLNTRKAPRHFAGASNHHGRRGFQRRAQIQPS
jgi:hypothetical protein